MSLGRMGIFGCLLPYNARTVTGPLLWYTSLGRGVASVCGSDMQYQHDVLARVPCPLSKRSAW